MGKFSVARQFVFPLALSSAAACISACGGHGGSGSPIPNTPSLSKPTRAGAQTYASGATSMTITPNFQPGFGPVYFTRQSVRNAACYQNGYLPTTPAPGPAASLNSGSVDFGSIQQGQDYLYRYAARVAVTSPSGFSLYGGASSDLIGPTTLPVASHLFWLPTTANGNACYGSSDGNNTYLSPSTPFLNAGPNTETLIAAQSAASATLSYDYIFRVGVSDPIGAYNSSIIYTVVPR